MENTDEGTEIKVQDPSSEVELDETGDEDDGSGRFQLEQLRAQAGLGHVTVEMRQELYNRFLEFEIQLGTCSPQQQIFILALLNDPTNQVAAGRAAGYSEASLKPHVSKLVRNPKIAHIIALGQNIREDRTFITADRTLQELALIAYSDVSDYTVEPGTQKLTTREGVNEMATRAVASAEFKTTVVEGKDGQITTTFNTKIKMWNKVDALRVLALYQKLVKPDNHVTINNKNEAGSRTTWNFGGKEIEL